MLKECVERTWVMSPPQKPIFVRTCPVFQVAASAIQPKLPCEICRQPSKLSRRRALFPPCREQVLTARLVWEKTVPKN